MINFVQHRRLFFGIAGALLVLSLVAMGVSLARNGQLMRISIDFVGGSMFTVQFAPTGNQVPTEAAIHDVFVSITGDQSPMIQRLGTATDYEFQIRTKAVTADQIEGILVALNEKVAPVDRSKSSVDSVDAAVGGEVTRTAGMAVTFAAFAVLLFIWYSFRRVPHAFRYGVASLIAMSVNVIVTLGFYSLMGTLMGWEADSLFLTALLTVIGFSVQDVIVVFDRIRENIPRHRGEPYELIVNRSVMETVHRSLATQLNAMFVMVAILLFGGASIKPFIATMLVGMLSETFTSLCVAVPILAWWESRNEASSASA